MAQAMQMFQRHPGSSLLIEHDVGNPLQGPVAGHTDCWQQRRLLETGIDRDEPFHTSLEQKLRVVAKHVEVVAMNYRQEKVIVLPEIGLNPADDHGAVRVTDLLEDKSYGIGAFLTQRSG